MSLHLKLGVERDLLEKVSVFEWLVLAAGDDVMRLCEEEEPGVGIFCGGIGTDRLRITRLAGG